LTRAIDRTVAVLALPIALPLGAAIALAIRLGSPGPVLHVQRRVGRDGRIFRMVKFRTMHADAEQDTGPVWALYHDPRCTTLGRCLRRTSLDELPQLWNVLRGEMSLVGPRPERPVFAERFSRELPGYARRHAVLPGITGWAQIHGWRGDTSVAERLAHDLHYVEHASAWLDLAILGRTIAGGFLNRPGTSTKRHAGSVYRTALWSTSPLGCLARRNRSGRLGT